MSDEQAYRAGQQDCRDGVPVEQGLEDFMRDAVTQADALSVTEELKPCPFCGGEELSHGYEMAGSYFAGNAQCHTCNAYIVADTEAEAITAWNTRLSHSTPGDAEVRKKLERHLSEIKVAAGLIRCFGLSANQDDMAAGIIGHAKDALKALATPSGRAQGEGEPVAWTGSGSLIALKDGREGFIWPQSAPAHPIPLYAAPPAQDQTKGDEA